MAEVVVSLIARDPDRVVRDSRRAAMAGADWIELRLDVWPRQIPLRPVIDAIGLPVLAAVRTPRDGGSWRGSARERVELLQAAIDAGASGVDVEEWETWSPRGDAVRLLVRSCHDLRGVPKDLQALRDRMLDQGADVAKIVGRVDDLAEAAPLLELLAGSDPEAEPTTAFALGESASITRVLGVALGAPLVYASLAAGQETAPGQLTVDELVGVFGVRSLGPASRLFGLLGDPARHSIGPWVHNRALRAAGVDGVYLPFESSRPREVIGMLPRRRLGGLSVTAPHKEVAATFCHRLSEDAEILEAVNTLTFEAHAQVVGHNTDVAGVCGALARHGGGVGSGGHGVVVGGGGAARAAALALEKLGYRVTMVARTLEPIRAFARRRGYRVAGLRTRVLAEDPPAALVNATPIGSQGHETEGRLPLPDWTPARDCRVLDMVYRPHKTPLLAAAAAAGAVPIQGLEMFLTQAAEQIALFVGQRPREDDLRRYLAGFVADGA